MGLICEIFGHKPTYYSKGIGSDYAKIIGDYEDGTGRKHAEVRGECARCGKEFTLARVHLPTSPAKHEFEQLREAARDAAIAIRKHRKYGTARVILAGLNLEKALSSKHSHK